MALEKPRLSDTYFGGHVSSCLQQGPAIDLKTFGALCTNPGRARLFGRELVLILRGTQPREPAPQQSLCAEIGGFSLFAAMRVRAHDRQ